MAEEQHLRRAAAEFRQQVITPVGSPQPCDVTADRLEARGQLVTAPIHGGLVGGRGFKAYQRLSRFNEPLALSATEVAQI
jgi:hypothetical protein